MTAALQPLEGKYEIVSKIREGGMGALYKVRHRLLDEIRVVKVVRHHFKDDAELHERFVNEARSAIQLRHPNVVQIFDFLLEEGVGYIVMEHIDGVDLGELIQRPHRPSLPLFLEVARQGLRALGYLHQQGFVHRDISPDNLMLCRDFAGRPLVKMIDLGIAKKVDGDSGITTSGMFLGKFRYSSPEHFGAQGVGGVEPRSDLYSFGVVLYEFLTGTYPVRGEGESQLIAGHLFHPPMEFAEADPEGRVPKALRDVLLRALDKDPARRFASAADFARDLASLQEQFPLNDAALEEAEAVAVAETADEGAGSGSTQSRLDRGFVHPTPAHATDGVVSPSRTERLRREHVEALLGGVETLLRLGQSEPARAQLVTILEIDPDNARARELLRGLAAPSADDDDDDATIVMGGPPPARLPDFEERRFDHHLRTACTLVDEGGFADAVPHFEAALEAQPGNEMVLGLLEEARAKLEEQRRTTRSLLASEVAQLRDLVDAGELAKARERLLSARRAYGDAEPLVDVQNDIERRASLAEARRVEEVAEEAAGLREAGDFTLAARALERARETLRAAKIRASDVALDLTARLELEEASLERDLRHAAEIDEAVFRIEKEIEAGRLMEADRALFQASERFDHAEPRFLRLRERLDELHHQAFAEQVGGLLEEAATLARHGDFNAARARLDKARAVAPAGSTLREEVERREAALAEAVTARVTALIHEAGTALEEGRPAAAVPFLEQALVLSPDDEWLVARLEQARAALEQE